MSKSSRLLVALLLAFVLVAAACGGDDDGEGSTGTTAADTTTTAADDDGDGGDGDGGEGAEADLDTYCEKTLEIETLGEPDIDFESLSEEEQAAAARDFASESLQPLAAEIEAAAPEEIAEDIAVLVAAVDEVAETGDFSVFETPETQEASDNAHAFDLENCGWSQVDVTAIDYGFEGLDGVEAGAASFELTNDGEEVHELVLLRKNDGTTESAEELLALPQEEAMGKVTFVGVAFADPGDDDYFVADLEAGDYMAVCFIPVGATEDNPEGNGPPHFTQGMVHEFTVG